MATTELDVRRAEARKYAPLWMRKRSKSVSVAKAVILTITLVVILFPVINVVLISLMTQKDLLKYSGSLDLFPRHLTLAAYHTIFAGGIVVRSLIISVSITLIGTFLSLAVSSLLAYGLSVEGLPGRRSLLLFILVTFLFTPGIIPLFLTVKGTGLLDTYASLIIPSMISTFNVIVLRSFFMNIPREVVDSANCDGAGYGKIFLYIVLPLSKPVLAVMGLFYAVGYWDAFFNALLYLNDSSKWPIQLVLQQYVISNSTLPQSIASLSQSVSVQAPEQSVQMAVVVIATVPILLVYPFLQRYFVHGVLTGAVKG
jgi:putative aldouronate transport system permease protein